MLADERECETGRPVGKTFIVCSSYPDPNNICAETSPEDQCKMCGLFWADGVCMVEDPREKAKDEIKKELNKEKDSDSKDAKGRAAF